MSVRLRWDQTCVVDGCKRPARELGGHCAACWRGLAPFERDLLRWEAAIEDAQPTAPIDSHAVALCVEPEAMFELPAVEPRRAA